MRAGAVEIVDDTLPVASDVAETLPMLYPEPIPYEPPAPPAPSQPEVPQPDPQPADRLEEESLAEALERKPAEAFGIDV